MSGNYKVVTFGEAMLRLSPQNFERLEHARSLRTEVGGGELNVAVILSRMGVPSAWVSALPNNTIGHMVRNKAREHGVDTDNIAWSKEGRVGLYFMEYGALPRASRVIYDRAGSAISMIKPGDIDWEKVLKPAKHLHTSGITPALSKSAAEVTKEALVTAKKLGLTVSYDLNYRAKLWTEAESRKCQEPLMEYVDVLITTEEDTNKVFGIKGTNYEEVAKTLADKFKFKVVTITLRKDITVWTNDWTAIAYADGKLYKDKTYSVEIVDRVGAGDSYSGGFIYGYIDGDIDKGVKHGNALAALKHSMPGDLNWSTKEEVEAQIKGAGLRISR
ncbi:MAG: sugar kinase [Elusimicrobiota bacterium]